MTVDMQMLIATSILDFMQPLTYIFSYLYNWGPVVAFGNRDNVPALPAWTDRALRAHRNTTENLVHFAALVLAVNYLGYNLFLERLNQVDMTNLKIELLVHGSSLSQVDIITNNIYDLFYLNIA